ncbi:MAG: DMT family transporter [Acidobacteria bacterium]|nr:DMT family transporter [Acidobacteriota bacterium]
MGELFALLFAVTWAAAVILFKHSGETVSPFALNFLRVTVSTVLLVATLYITGGRLLSDAPLADYLILLLSGFIAIIISDTLFHQSLNMLGAGLTAIVECMYSPFMVMLGYLLLAEKVSLWQMGGMGLVIAGVIMVVARPGTVVVRGRQLTMGIVWCVTAMFTLALGIVIAKPVLEHSSVLWATTVRQTGCLIMMVILAGLSPNRRRFFGVFRPAVSWKSALPGTVLGSYLALLCWIAGMKYTQVGVAAILNQTSTFFIILLAVIFLGETFSRRQVLASLVAMAGLVMVVCG